MHIHVINPDSTLAMTSRIGLGAYALPLPKRGGHVPEAA